MALPKRRHDSGNSPTEPLGAFIPALASFKMAAVHLGASNGEALRKRFARGLYPKRFLVQLTPSRPGVDLHAIIIWIRRGSRDRESPAMLAPESHK